MAPFGKNFLKARLKNRIKDTEAEAVPGKEIQVLVCDEDKVVCGVTKHTTCADMVRALLDDHNNSVPESKRLLHGDPEDFCLLERWKGFERALPPLTRILRLWNAWGDQRPFIQFVLVKTSDFVPQTDKKSSKPKGAKPKRWEQGPTHYSQTLPVERQRRLVKKAFRKLEKIHKEKKTAPGAEEVDRMVQLIISQDHAIRQQIQRMRELDVEIERREEEGQEAGQEPEPEERRAQSTASYEEEQLQEYLCTSDGVEQLERQVRRHEALILQLSRDIDAELTCSSPSPWCDVPEEDALLLGAAAALAPGDSSDVESSFYVAELERLQSELKYSLSTGVSLHTQTAHLEKELKCYDAALTSKDRECWTLASQLSSLHLGDGAQETPRTGAPKGPAPQSSGVASQEVRLKHGDVTDTDSDTGISSTHSQDSLSPCLDSPPPPLPLDTDV